MEEISRLFLSVLQPMCILSLAIGSNRQAAVGNQEQQQQTEQELLLKCLFCAV